MTFDEIVEATTGILKKRGRVSFRALRRQFDIDDEYVQDLRAELVDVLRVAREEDGTTLVHLDALADRPPSQPAPPTAPLELLAPRDEPIVASPIVLPEAETSGVEAERRRLTVMFCDLVGSTELSERFDPEELAEMYGRWQEAVAATIARFGGHVADYRGDGVFVYFGYPSAYEDGASRAVRASLAVVEMLDTLNTSLERSHDVRFRVRVGLHSGLVVLSDLGGKHAQPRFAFGETPNIAARVQALAGPDEVLVTSTIGALTRRQFELAFLGDRTLKGISRPVGVYRAVREIDEEVATESKLPDATPLVARDSELGLLRRLLSLVADGHGQTVLLSGEAGIGKSRLLAAVGQAAVDAGARRIRIHCEAQHAASALHPIVQILGRLYGAASQSPEDGLARLRSEFGEDAEAEEHFASLAVLAGLREASTLAGRAPDAVRERTLEAVAEWLACAASAQMLFLAIEDVHWADPTTLEVIARILQRIDGLRSYVALTYRPEFNAPWPHRSNVSQFMLGRLTDADAEALIRAKSGERQLGTATIATIVERADGIPLYLEEIVASVLAAGSAENLSIPETLHDSLMARLDRLADVREIAQLAAVLGREFSYEVMREVSTADEQTLRPALARLVAEELLQRHGSGAKTSYQFRHALMRDIAHDSTLIVRRQQFHRRVADVLQARLSTGLGGASEIVAYHYTEAREYARALTAWRVAAEASVASSALRETLSQTASGIALAEKVPPSIARARDLLALYMARGSALVALSGQGSPEVEATYARALALCDELGDTRDLFFVRFGVWRFYITRYDVAMVKEIAEELFERSARLKDRDIAVGAHMALGFILYHAGEVHRAMEIVDAGTRVFVESLASDPRKLDAFAGQNPAMGLLLCGAFIKRLVGRPDEALPFESRAFRICKTLDSPFQTACARVFRAMLDDLRGDAEAALADAEAAIALADEHAFPLWRILGRLQRGSALASLGGSNEGIAQMQAALEAMETENLLMFRTRAAVLLATAALRADRVADGRQAIAKARAVWSTSAERWWAPEIDRLEGELLARSDSADRPRARPLFEAALANARRAGLVLLAERAAASLARVDSVSPSQPEIAHG